MVESTGLENRRSSNGPEGSNPSPSAQNNSTMTKQEIIQNISAKLPEIGAGDINIPKDKRPVFSIALLGQFSLFALSRSKTVEGTEYIRCFIDFDSGWGTSQPLEWFPYSQLEKIHSVLAIL